MKSTDTYNVRDCIEIKNPGYFWDNYFSKFKEPGMKDPDRRRNSPKKGAIGVILKIAEYEVEDKMLVIELEDGEQILMSSKGVKPVLNAQIINYEIY